MDTMFGSKKRYTAPRPRVPEHLEFFSSSSLRVARASTQRRAMSHNDHSLLTTGCASASCFFFLLLLLLAHYSWINRTLSNENQLITTFAALLTLAGGRGQAIHLARILPSARMTMRNLSVLLRYPSNATLYLSHCGR